MFGEFVGKAGIFPAAETTNRFSRLGIAGGDIAPRAAWAGSARERLRFPGGRHCCGVGR